MLLFPAILLIDVGSEFLDFLDDFVERFPLGFYLIDEPALFLGFATCFFGCAVVFLLAFANAGRGAERQRECVRGVFGERGGCRLLRWR